MQLAKTNPEQHQYVKDIENAIKNRFNELIRNLDRSF